jgi:predicted dehydrogenase
LAEIPAQTSPQAVLGISHTLRYYPPYRLIHDIVQQGLIGQPLYLEYSLGQYLPGWHPYEDYRRFYASDAGLGGAGMDMILHEIAAIQWWLGAIGAVYARFGKVSSLEIKGPDTQDVLLTFANGCLGFFHHDLIEQGTQGRHIRLTGAEGTLEWHQHQPAIRLYRAAEPQNRALSFQEAQDWPEARQASQEMSEILARQQVASGQAPSGGDNAFTYESCYLREMRHFLGAAQGRHPYTMGIAEELQTVRVFQAIVESSQSRQEVGVEG